MSQHDFNIANQGFPATRTDLNNALAALATNSSGASAPSTTYAYQWWYDTANNILKMRDAGNTAWINFAFFDQVNDTWLIQQTSGGNVGIGAAPAASAILDLTSTSKGFRAPSMTTTQRNAISSPATGLMIYNTTTSAYEFYNGSSWQSVTGSGGMTLLGTLTTTSGSTQTLSSLTLTSYNTLLFVFDGVSHNSGSNQSLTLNGVTFTNARGSASLFIGPLVVYLDTGFAIAQVDQSPNSSPSNTGIASGYSRSSTSLTVGVTGGTFDAGSVKIYGVK